MNEQALPELWKQWSLTEGAMTARQAAHEFAKFRDYWIAVPGQKGVKLDWFATWRNWCRRAADDATTRKRGDGPTPSAASMLGLNTG